MVKQIKKDGLKHRLQIDGNDELGQLGKEFNDVLDQLETSMASMGVTSESLSDMSQSFGVNESGISIKNALAPYKRLKSL